MLNIKKFRHIAIVVNYYQKMVDFYSKILGFKIIREFEIGSKDFRKGVGIPEATARVAHLSVPGNAVELEIAEYQEKVERNSKLSIANCPGYRHIALVVENLETAYKDLKKMNIEFFSEPILITNPENVAGFKFVYFKDPEGNIVELNQLPEMRERKA
ncbi:MAG: hypothetical protein FD145_1361 [Candidatus Saganbacteria bacterium]|uniref:VOC domain-containing protein n=1 Tax=Candidatus Saganbacteria bacterium TaxID=2575572 RepID=A0A833L006_UNCSA|nr:MAG: hypothetical protein FD145_1361 [Candidatus Saganbacteria bacterium]